ncbi:MAG: hypothetical protein M0035_04045 [Actinomycetota bacterium]|nr:hypothetical protein [Actinomycetota bacterium]MDA8355497.1 hypothetical protein [Actinomycetota bacterium]
MRTGLPSGYRVKGGEYRRGFSGDVDLLVRGAVSTNVKEPNLKNPRRGRSVKLIDAWEARQRGTHVHVVDAEGFFQLLNGRGAPCLRLRRSGELVTIEPHGTFGGLLTVRKVQRKPKVWTGTPRSIDIDHWDAATEAHEKTLEQLRDFLHANGITPRNPFPRGPKFDAGWTYRRRKYIAEVKSLRGAQQDQQIRLGVGQILDYFERLRARGAALQPVLVLEQRPREPDHWLRLCNAHSIRLTWAPSFTDLLP